jgi:hypothetical protein
MAPPDLSNCEGSIRSGESAPNTETGEPVPANKMSGFILILRRSSTTPKSHEFSETLCHDQLSQDISFMSK